MSRATLKDRLLDCYPRWSPNAYRIALGGGIACAIAIPLAMIGLPFIEFFNGMAAQPKGKAQMTFGRIYGEEFTVERAPVKGTIPRDYHPYYFDGLANTIEAAKEVGERLKNPVPLTMDALSRGQEMFNVYCIVCHGARGEGDGPVIGAQRFPAPPSLHTKQAIAYKDGTLYHIMTKGIGKMPSYADKLSSEQRWMVAYYVRALQRSMAPKPGDAAQ